MNLSVEQLKALAGIVSDAPAEKIPQEISPRDVLAESVDKDDMRSYISASEGDCNEDCEDYTEEELDEWANTPEGVSELDSREMELPPGETVDISLRRHLGADPKHVKVEESGEIFKSKDAHSDYSSSELMEAYESYKHSTVSEEVAGSFIEYKDDNGRYVVVYSRAKGGYKILGKGDFRGEFTHAGVFDDIGDAVEHAEITIDGMSEYVDEDMSQASDYIEHRDDNGRYVVVYSRAKGGYKVLGKGDFRGEFTHAGVFDDIGDAVEHAELTIDGMEDIIDEAVGGLKHYVVEVTANTRYGLRVEAASEEDAQRRAMHKYEALGNGGGHITGVYNPKFEVLESWDVSESMHESADTKRVIEDWDDQIQEGAAYNVALMAMTKFRVEVEAASEEEAFEMANATLNSGKDLSEYVDMVADVHDVQVA